MEDKGIYSESNINKHIQQTAVRLQYTDKKVILLKGRSENLGYATILPREGAAERWRSRFFFYEPSDEDSAKEEQ